MSPLAPAPLLALACRLTLAVGALAWLAWSVRGALARTHAGLAGDERFLAVFTWCAAALTGSAILLGAVGALRFETWLAAIALTGLAVRVRPRGNGAAAAPQVEDGAPPAWLTVTLCGVFAGYALFVMRNPTADEDSITYHIPMFAHWMASGTLGVPTRVPFESASFYPGGSEVLQMWAAWATGRDTLVQVPQLIGLTALAFAARRLAIRAGAKATLAGVAAVAFASSGIAWQLAKGLFADAFLTTWLMVAMHFLVRWRDRNSRADLTVGIAALGLAAGCRFTGPPLAAALLALAVLAPPARRPRAHPLAWTLAALIGGFWLLRNAISAGNPLYPAEAEIFGRHLPGLLPQSWLAPTTQVAMWRAGQAGTTTPANLWHYYGPLTLAIVGGLLAWLVARRWRGRGVGAAIPTTFAAVSAALAFLSYYSGATAPARGSEPPHISTSSVRFLLPAVFALLPAALSGLSSTPWLTMGATAALAVLSLWQLFPHASHALPGIAIAAAVALAMRWWWRQPRVRGFGTAAAALLVMVALTGVVAISETRRERLADQIFRGYYSRLRMPPPEIARVMREGAAGRPIACVGLLNTYVITGRRFDGRPGYVPVASPLADARRPWCFWSESRAHPDRERWLANLEQAQAAYVTIAWDASEPAPIEAAWCAADSVHFRPLWQGERRVAYEWIPAATPR